MTIIVILRLIHIFSGVFWAGTTFFLVSSLGPTARAAGPEGGRFMQRLIGPGRMTMLLALAATLTVLSGILLSGILSGGFSHGWVASGPGLTLAIGGVAGIVAWLIGGLVVGRAGTRLAALGREIQASGGPPSPEQAAALQALQRTQSQGSILTAIFLIVALIGMSAAQYVWF